VALAGSSSVLCDGTLGTFNALVNLARCLGRFLCQSSFLNFFVWLASLTHVNLPNMNVKHLAQERLFRKTIAYEIKSHSRAKRAPRTQEVMFRLGFQD
jgi:hypothetical protein